MICESCREAINRRYLLFPNEDLILNGGVVDEAVGNHIEMMKTFVLSEVFPNISQRVPDSCAIIIGKAFLWFLSIRLRVHQTSYLKTSRSISRRN